MGVAFSEPPSDPTLCSGDRYTPPSFSFCRQPPAQTTNVMILYRSLPHNGTSSADLISNAIVSSGVSNSSGQALQDTFSAPIGSSSASQITIAQLPFSDTASIIEIPPKLNRFLGDSSPIQVIAAAETKCAITQAIFRATYHLCYLLPSEFVSDMSSMRQMASAFKGSHDLHNFSADSDHSIVTINELTLSDPFQMCGESVVECRIAGRTLNGRTVLGIIGCLLLGAKEHIDKEGIALLFSEVKRAVPPAPPEFLVVDRIELPKAAADFNGYRGASEEWKNSVLYPNLITRLQLKKRIKEWAESVVF